MTRRLDDPTSAGFRLRAWLGPEIVGLVLSIVVILIVLWTIATGVLSP